MTNCIHDHGRWGKGDQIGAGHLLTPELPLTRGKIRPCRDDGGGEVDPGFARLT